jgi:hypothetical protein
MGIAAALCCQPALAPADPPPTAPGDPLRAEIKLLATPIEAYPDHFGLPDPAASPIAPGDQSDDQNLSQTSTAAAAYAFTRPSTPEEYLIFLRELEEVPFLTLWQGDSTRVFFGLDEDRHPGLHFSPRRD